MVSGPLLTISTVAAFHMNFSFNSIVLLVLLCNILMIARPDISSINGAFTLINLCTFDFSMIHFFEKLGKDLFKNLKQQSHEFLTPSDSNTFLIPNTRSMFSWLSDTNVYISNLCPWISTITGIRTLTN